MKTNKIIFFGNGLLANSVYSVLNNYSNLKIIFHAKTRDDLEKVKKIKLENPNAFGVLASFGVLIMKEYLDLFEPEGIINIHPSLLPEYRGASPIETAILDGKKQFSVSIMKLVKEMDAGPIYYQKTLENLPLDKKVIYETLAKTGATWLAENISNIKNLYISKKYLIQDSSKATFSKKFEKNDGELNPNIDSAETIFRKIVAFQNFPKPKLTLFGKKCIILSAEPTSENEQGSLSIECADGNYLKILQLQPESRKPMDYKSFLNGLKNVK